MNPTILHIGPIIIRAYPLMLALAFLVGTLLEKNARRLATGMTRVFMVSGGLDRKSTKNL